MPRTTARLITSPRDPVFARTACRAATDLTPSLQHLATHARALETWFTLHGDPFTALTDSQAFVADHAVARDEATRACAAHSNAQLVANLGAALAELDARLANAARRPAAGGC